MATFPSYAKLLFEGYSQKRESALLRTEMEYGPPKQAKIKSTIMLTRSAKIYLSSKADYVLFEEWYSQDINEGASWFNFTDPVSNQTIQARFVGGGYTAAPMSASMEQWQLEANIESWVTNGA